MLSAALEQGQHCGNMPGKGDVLSLLALCTPPLASHALDSFLCVFNTRGGILSSPVSGRMGIVIVPGTLGSQMIQVAVI